MESVRVRADDSLSPDGMTRDRARASAEACITHWSNVLPHGGHVSCCVTLADRATVAMHQWCLGGAVVRASDF